MGPYEHVSASKRKCLEAWAHVCEPSSTSMSVSMWVCKCLKVYDHERISAYNHVSYKPAYKAYKHAIIEASECVSERASA